MFLLARKIFHTRILEKNPKIQNSSYFVGGEAFLTVNISCANAFLAQENAIILKMCNINAFR